MAVIFLFAASETHYVWLKMEIVGIPLPVNETSQQRRVSPDTMGYFHSKASPKFQNTAMCCLKGEGGSHCNVTMCIDLVFYLFF